MTCDGCSNDVWWDSYKVGTGDDAARRIDQPHMQREHVALAEERRFGVVTASFAGSSAAAATDSGLFTTMRLRAAEMQTMFRLGCSHMTIAKLHSSEIVLLLCAASVLAGAAALLTLRFPASVLRSLLF